MSAKCPKCHLPILKGGDGSGGADHVMPINILLLGITIDEHIERDPILENSIEFC